MANTYSGAFERARNTMSLDNQPQKRFRVKRMFDVVVAIVLTILLFPLLVLIGGCLLYTSPSPRDLSTSRMPSSA